MELTWDRVRFRISAHRDVPTTSVRVFVSATVTVPGDESPKVAERVRSALQSVLQADWKAARVQREEDKSGMEQMQVQATTRVDEHQTAGLAERLRQVSRAGLRLQLTGIKQTPPQDEVEVALRELRTKLYREAQIEADLLNKTLPSDTKPWRVASITINDGSEAAPLRHRGLASRSTMLEMTADKSLVDSENLVVGTRLELAADVVLTRPALVPPEKSIP